jgi:glycine/D-amino acid oxidase-like deaminating enzyme/nitrite reductase/ring-hydroxylating ferredoxin subunit
MAPHVTDSRHVAIWTADAPATSYPSLDGDGAFDVVVVGGGITGLTTALLLARDGHDVGLLDQGAIATGTSGHTTAKVTSQHHLTYARIRTTHGRDAARTYGTAMEAAKEQVAALAGEGIECDLRRRPAYVYATRSFERPLLARETRAAQEAGLPASLDADVPLPFSTLGGMRFDDQLEIHARRYLLGLADRLVEAGGAIFEGTRAVHVSEAADGCVVHTERGQVRAGHVVVATLMPFLDRSGLFARAHASRSYVVTARVRGGLPSAGLMAAAPPLHSIRSVPHRGEELLMVLGESHHAGSPKATPERYERLADFVTEHWDVTSFEHRWSSQDFASDDGVPYIGRLNVRSKRVHVATGFRKWGMTAGTLAGMLVTDAIAGRENAWAPLFSTTRVKPLAEAPRFLAENGRVGVRFLGDRLVARGTRDIEDLEPGEGAIVRCNGEKVAGFRDDDGTLHAVSARCTHLGCQVAWNGAERSWDCPCHASRFTVDGEILNGPATKPLSRKQPPAGD